MAFVPSQDGKEVTVLLLNTTHQHLSDGSQLSDHKPLLIARAGNCSGDCPKRDADVAQFVFADQTTTVAEDSLEAAVGGGGAWILSGSDLSLQKGASGDPDLPALSVVTNVRGTANGSPLAIPTSSTERQDFSWITSLSQLCSTCALSTDLMASQPPGSVVARLHLRSGSVFTYSVARIGSNVTPVHFKRLDGSGDESGYSQAIATWVGADIQISGSSIEIVEDKFNGGTGRAMTLTPDTNGKVEMAVLNLPSFVPPASSINNAPQVGKHFEMYYDLADEPPATETRLVPRAGAAATLGTYPEVAWSTVHPSSSVSSALLNAIRLDVGRGPYDRILCPPIQP